MNLTQQYQVKLEERQAFIENQSRLRSNLMKSINLVDNVTTQHLEALDDSLLKLAETIGVPHELPPGVTQTLKALAEDEK